MSSNARVNIDQPLWNQGTFYGRFRHFAFMTDSTTVLASTAELMAAKQLVEQYRAGREPAGTTEAQVIHAKKLFVSAFHPDTGELQNFVGRMSFQLPGNTIVTGCMLTFYRSMPAVMFWQLVNQSYNALVNYTNRNANSELSVNELALSFVTATTSALVAASACKTYWQRTAGPMMQRFVPFAAVAISNCVNIPVMRQQELRQGVEVCDASGQPVGTSRLAAAKGIGQVVFSRVVMAVPGMIVLPMITMRVEARSAMFRRRPWLSGPFQVLVNGCFLAFMVPFSCAIFPQNCSVKTSTLQRFEGSAYEKMLERRKTSLPETVFFNKGL